MGRASAAKRDVPLNAIYAVSFQKTPLHFPLVWDRSIDYVWAVNVTDRYAGRGKKPPEGSVAAMFRVLDHADGKRQRAALKITDAAGKTMFDGKSNDEGFDANDHTTVFLPVGLHGGNRGGRQVAHGEIRSRKADTTFTFTLDAK